MVRNSYRSRKSLTMPSVTHRFKESIIIAAPTRHVLDERAAWRGRAVRRGQNMRCCMGLGGAWVVVRG